MTRKLALLLAACLGLWHGSAWALGLGEIEVRSALNERFSATIELRRIEGLSQNEIIASLASAEDFSRLGVQRFFYLSELEFTTDLSNRDRPRIRISSNRPINEPFVNFVVDVRWPTGRMLREYTVLLDPPSYAERPTPTVRPAETLTPRTPAAPTRPQPGQVRTEPQPSPGAGRFDGDTYGVTDRNDTLWAIALEVRPSTDVSVQQTMLALQRLNPDAFIGGNINLLKAGYVLQVPGADEIARLSRQDAVVQVAEHNARWRDGTPVMPVDARPDVAVGDRAPRPAGELRLVAGEDDDVRASREVTAVGAVSDGEVEALRSDLADIEGRLSEAEAARTAAERQRREAASELEEVSRQLELRNQELARLQRQLAQQQQAPAAPSRPTTQGPLGLDWMLLAAGLVGLVLLIVAVMLLLRRRRAQLDDAPAVGAAVAPAAPAAPGAKSIEQTQLMPAISNEDLARAGIAAGAATASAAPAAVDDDSDVIAEADVYMAYGRFSEAARVLNSAIEADGQRADLRLKLMEVLVETQDVDAFNAQAEALRGFADDQTIGLADDLASRLPGAVTSSGVTSQGEAAGPARAADEGEVSLDFDLGDEFGEPADLDSLDIDFDASDGRKSPTISVDRDDDDLALSIDGDDQAAGTESGRAAEPDIGLDLDFDFDEPKGVTGVQQERSGAALDLDGGDLSLDDDLADGKREAGDAAPGSADGDDFDLDLPFADSSAAPGERVVDDEDELGGLEQPARDKPAAAEQGDAHPEFDLTLDEGGFAEKPSVDPVAARDDDGFGELEFDLTRSNGDAGDPELDRKASAPESGAAASEGGDVEGDDLGIDFDIEDLPAETVSLAGSAQDDPAAPPSGEQSEAERDDDEDFSGLRTSGGHGDAQDSEELSLDDFDDAATGSPTAPAAETPADLAVDLADDDLEFGMDFDEAGDETTTKLELARAYVDMGDDDGAKEILDEVLRDGNDIQQQEAAELLARLG